MSVIGLNKSEGTTERAMKKLIVGIVLLFGCAGIAQANEDLVYMVTELFTNCVATAAGERVFTCQYSPIAIQDSFRACIDEAMFLETGLEDAGYSVEQIDGYYIKTFKEFVHAIEDVRREEGVCN